MNEQAHLIFSDPEILEPIAALLPPYVVDVRTGERGRPFPHTPSLVRAMLDRALCEGWLIDRTNGDGPLAEWDGWLKIDGPKPTHIRIARPGGKPLEP